MHPRKPSDTGRRSITAPTSTHLLVGAAALLVSTLAARPADARPRQNSQTPLPNNLYLADLDGDGAAELLQLAGNRLFVTRDDPTRTNVLHMYLSRSATRLLVGHFAPGNRDQVCAVLEDGSLPCYGISNDGTALWWWFTQPTFLGASDDVVVGDYDGDGYDDVLAYDHNSGAIRVFSRAATGAFAPMPHFVPGNLQQTTGMRLRAVDLGGPRTSLVTINSAGSASVLGSQWDGVNNTFWWWFNTPNGFVHADDQVTTARIDDDAIDELVLRSAAGATRFFHVQPAAGNLMPQLTTVSLGQLAASANAQVFWGHLKRPLTEPGGSNRDDAYVYEPASGYLYRSDARWDGTRGTYYWVDSHPAPTDHAGWPAVQQQRWLILLCKYHDQNQQPWGVDFFQQLFSERGNGLGGMYDYFRDITWGTVDLRGTEVHGWYRISRTLAQSQATLTAGTYNRLTEINYCVNTATDVNPANYAHVIVVMNSALNAQNADGGAIAGRVLANPATLTPDFLGHEMLHAMGLGPTQHAYGPFGGNPVTGEYGDPWDVMSAMIADSFTSANFYGSGPNLNMGYKDLFGWVPSSRTVAITNGGGRTQTITLAAASRPEANGALVARIALPTVMGASYQPAYYVEYRINEAWDAGFGRGTRTGRPAIFIHNLRTSGTTVVQTVGTGTAMHGDLIAGDVFRDTTNGVTITVNSLDTPSGTASVTVRY